MEKGYSRLRRGRVSEIGRPYHVVFSTLDRKPYFRCFFRARSLVQLMNGRGVDARLDTLAYVVMPDHVHWLFILVDGELSQVVQCLKSYFTKRAGENIWSKGFYDHAIRSDESLINVARYIVANPLRAGLVERVGDYPHWDSIWLE